MREIQLITKIVLSSSNQCCIGRWLQNVETMANDFMVFFQIEKEIVENQYYFQLQKIEKIPFHNVLCSTREYQLTIIVRILPEAYQ